MISSKQILSTAVATALIGGAGVAAAAPAMAAPTATNVSVTSMTTGQMTITIDDFAYAGPGTATPGAVISVTNNDSEVHTVTADDGSFDVTVPGGETATFTAPAEGGDYGYFCKFHGNMKGTLTVAAGAAAPAPEAAPSPSAVPAQPDADDADDSDADDMAGMDQMDAVPEGGADTGVEQTVPGDNTALVLGGGLSLIALAGGAYAVRRRITA